MKWTNTKVGCALHDGKDLVATLKVRPLGVTARWHNGMTWDISDQVKLLPQSAAKASPVRVFKNKREAKTAISEHLANR
ncbi:MAG: hypothetical protein K8L99_33750 [Anaerolineae bacterium]|nr:hypothetical protein [Anaerolineae bacterium]